MRMRFVALAAGLCMVFLYVAVALAGPDDWAEGSDDGGTVPSPRDQHLNG